jgi:integrase
MVDLRLKYLVEDRDRHGNKRIYFKRKGFAKVRLRGEVGSDEFMAAYAEALNGARAAAAPRLGENARTAPRGSLRALTAAYVAAPEFTSLAPATRAKRRAWLEALCARPNRRTGLPLGLGPVSAIAERHVFAWRDEKAETPEEATFIVKTLRGFFKWAHARRLVAHNPAKDVPYLRQPTDGFHSWTIEEVEQFEARHPVGTKARLAFALLLYTGQRRSDVVLFGLQHMRNGWLHFTQVKGRRTKPVTLSIPILPPLQAIIDATPRPAGATSMTFLLTDYGRAFTAAGFGNKMRQWCDEAGLPHCSSHGLRKAFGARAAEEDLTARQIMAILGHSTLEEAERYTRAASQKKLAAAGMAKIEAALKNRG